MKSKTYKSCAVPQCKSTTIKTPDKLFIYVPNKKIIRDKWLKLARRNTKNVTLLTCLYFCEDHFDMPNDMKNYMEYHVMGSVSKVLMKPGCVPKKFLCQPDRISRTPDTKERPYMAKKRRMIAIQECEEYLKEKDTQQSRLTKIASAQQNVEELPNNQAKVSSVNQMTSSLRLSQNSVMTSPFKIKPSDNINPSNGNFWSKIIKKNLLVINKTKMAESNYNCTEKLILFKNGAKELSVPCKDLTQHQIDGIRFLFKQYKKTQPGVIMNYPPGCGTSVQVAMFLQAIHMELEKPVLILYETEDEKEKWLERFRKCTDIDNDKIAVNPANIYVKKLIHLNEIANLKNCYRSWSIVIVKSDENKKEIVRSNLKADFKIWITSIDMKKDCEMLQSIYFWMNTAKTNVEVKKILENAEKSYTDKLLMESLLEDTLLTARDLKHSQTLKRQHEPEIVMPKVTRKNKDATGLKIKRSKKNKEAPLPSDNTKSAVALNSDIDNVLLNNNKVNDIEKATEDEPKLDVESFIRDNDPLESDCHLNMAVNNLDTDTALLDTIVNNSEIEDLEKEGSLNIASHNVDANNVTQFDTSLKDSPKSPFSVKLINDDDQISEEDENAIPLIADTFSMKTEGDIDIEFQQISKEKENTMPLIENTFSIQTEDEERDVKVEFHETDGATNNGKVVTDESIDVERDQESKVEVTTSVIEETDNSFDSKIKQMEERALRKFKGSILDSIF